MSAQSLVTAGGRMTFDFGDEAVFTTTDETGNIVRRTCTIVGITTVDDERQSAIFRYPSGTVLYTVEFSDGSDLLVVEETLQPF
jgi:hypothetical protein